MNTMLPGDGPTDSSSTDSPRLGFRVPPAFFELPVHEGPDRAGEALIEPAQDIHPQGTAELWDQYAAAQLPTVGELIDAGVGCAGFCLLDLDGRRSTATVTASLPESVPGGKRATAASMPRNLRAPGNRATSGPSRSRRALRRLGSRRRA
ncbi:hypothetical protein SUDANB6_01515 [Streptomyces sp. enrichment culture]|uniref:hypothetical protein n=1 Tax=Streptomyces sp. enrichment culture TaxID=1795815 RepID=UPI003F560097